MALFNWKEEYSVSVRKFDDHHKKLISLINELHEGMLTGKHKDIVGNTISELLKYTKYHFGEEEKLMAVNRYPGLAEHKAQHEAFTKKVLEFIAKYEAGKATVTLDVVNFLREWLKGHILQTDKKYTAFFAANKVA